MVIALSTAVKAEAGGDPASVFDDFLAAAVEADWYTPEKYRELIAIGSSDSRNFERLPGEERVSGLRYAKGFGPDSNIDKIGCDSFLVVGPEEYQKLAPSSVPSFRIWAKKYRAVYQVQFGLLGLGRISKAQVAFAALERPGAEPLFVQGQQGIKINQRRREFLESLGYGDYASHYPVREISLNKKVSCLGFDLFFVETSDD